LTSRRRQAGARTRCPNAAVSFDPFHVIALANEALAIALLERLP
jgi:transposase